MTSTVPRTKTILIVEDNDLNMRLFGDLLTSQGYVVSKANNGMSGFHLAQEQRPDLIVMDIQLPDVSGLEVSRWLKEDLDLQRIPILAVTAFAMAGDAERIRKGGCDGYMSKPINIREFLKVVQKLLE
jgi:two-component system cell cycle response regulator DivK